MNTKRALLILTAFVPASALGAPEAVQRLSDAQVEQVLAEAASRREAREALAPKPQLQIHGEAGVAVGTGGYRAAFGTAVVPLGGDALAILSFSSETGGDTRRRH